ncbi:alpha-hydroxy acid oxidase [Quatrionicoccus australiensis]|uniref:alpha-hydroxy acid oxidase n=1 Tax=Quatrionicoccus australiensis TaxID=138118 RepID=UPI001CF90E75|nr:alpha-hydroxy acid oxidase [Quatrionicoccus australiensis]UCV15774.1 alpha-hydroxy-acid oxidizing protein [Quatrionicoccus australiensis]
MNMPLPPLDLIPHDLVAACDYEARARQHLDDNAWAYLQGGAADELSLRGNGEAFQSISLRPRVLRDLTQGHTRCCLFGQELAHPLLLAPVAYQRLFHPDGELASVLGASVMGAGMLVSTLASTRLEDIASQAGSPLWFQLYWQGGRDASLALVRRAEAAGYQALVLTVDAPLSGIRNREQRAGFALPPKVAAVNLAETPKMPLLTPNDSPVFAGMMALAPTWADIEWLRAQTRLPLLLKGVLHPEDAAQAVSCGVHGLVISNHGGRVLDTTPAPLDLLPEMRARVGASVTLLLDGGIRRGSDVFKALALGADAVLLGRPYVHALAVAGALGVAHLIKLLREELEVCMALSGCATLAEITPDRLWLDGLN